MHNKLICVLAFRIYCTFKRKLCWVALKDSEYYMNILLQCCQNALADIMKAVFWWLPLQISLYCAYVGYFAESWVPHRMIITPMLVVNVRSKESDSECQTFKDSHIVNWLHLRALLHLSLTTHSRDNDNIILLVHPPLAIISGLASPLTAAETCFSKGTHRHQFRWAKPCHDCGERQNWEGTGLLSTYTTNGMDQWPSLVPMAWYRDDGISIVISPEPQTAKRITIKLSDDNAKEIFAHLVLIVDRGAGKGINDKYGGADGNKTKQNNIK